MKIDKTDKLWLCKTLPMLKDYIPDPASPDYVVIKMTPDNIRVTNPDVMYQQIELE